MIFSAQLIANGSLRKKCLLVTVLLLLSLLIQAGAKALQRLAPKRLATREDDHGDDYDGCNC